MRQDAAERLLRVVLRASGVVLCLALPTIFLPVAWMAAAHERLGLGPYPDGPLVEYLSRSVAALYGLHGILLLIVARDPRRYRDIVSYIAFFNIAFGLLMLGIDLAAGMPWLWTIAEGPPIAGAGLAIGLLNRRTARTEA